MSGPQPEFSVVHMVESPSPRAQASLSPDTGGGAPLELAQPWQHMVPD